jgi:hypothetical protein
MIMIMVMLLDGLMFLVLSTVSSGITVWGP